MLRLKRRLLRVTLLLCLISLGLSVSGCFHRKLVVLNDSEVVTAHPTDDSRVCMDKGYLYRIYEDCGVAK